MKENKQYIFPTNYNQREKFLGIVDYNVLIFIISLALINFYILKNMSFSIHIKIILLMVFVGIPSVFVIIGINGENMLSIFYFMIKYFFKDKIYVYRKVEMQNEKIYKKLVPNKKY